MTARAALADVGAWLDAYLRIAEVPDEPNAVNGLQVENSGMIGAIVAAVDASQATINGVVRLVQAAGTAGAAPLLLVHHGLFWDGNLPVRGRRYRRLKALLEHDIAVYSAHIALDAHPAVGNNAVLADMLGLAGGEPFDTYRGMPFGLAGALEMDRDALRRRVSELLGAEARLIPGGPPTTRRIGIITGGAGGRIRAAWEAGCDTFITGEGPHHTYFDATEFGVNLIYAGHYATEQVGVKALAARVAAHFGLPWEFHDHPTGT